MDARSHVNSDSGGRHSATVTPRSRRRTPRNPAVDGLALAGMMTFVPRNLPSGTVTFLFSDVEGSTRLLQERGAAEYAKALAEHRRIVREAFGAHGGVEVDTQGDAFFVAFPSAQGALEAARAITEGLKAGPIRVRIAIHTGTPHLSEEGYVGEDVHKGARIASAAHGGQVLLSSETRELAH